MKIKGIKRLMATFLVQYIMEYTIVPPTNKTLIYHNGLFTPPGHQTLLLIEASLSLAQFPYSGGLTKMSRYL